VGNGGMVIASDSLGLEEEGIGLEDSTDGSASAGSASTGSTSGASAGSKKHEDKAEVDESWF
jgi:hypothetical protein